MYLKKLIKQETAGCKSKANENLKEYRKKRRE